MRAPDIIALAADRGIPLAGKCKFALRRRPTWTLAEMQASADDVPPVPYMAARFAFAGEQANYWPLWAALHDEALRLAHREHWSVQVKGIDGSRHFYWGQLCALVLDECRYAELFSTPGLHAVYLGVSERTWDETLSGR